MSENRMHLTPRLRTIMAQVPQGARLADIGTDHALIPVALLRRGQITCAIASDIGTGPLESAARTARQFGFEQEVSLRLGAGLCTVKPEEADTIVIAGMGGETIAQILQNGAWAMDGSHLLLLQAMTAQPELRQFLAENGCKIQKETLCAEGKRMYTVMTVRGGGEMSKPELSDCCISDALLCDPLAQDYLHKLLTQEQKICASLEHAQHEKPEELAYHRASADVLSAALERLEKE